MQEIQYGGIRCHQTVTEKGVVGSRHVFNIPFNGAGLHKRQGRTLRRLASHGGKTYRKGSPKFWRQTRMSPPLGLRSPVEELSHWMRNSVSHFSASRTSLKVYSCLL